MKLTVLQISTSFTEALESENKSPHTIETYLVAVRGLAAHTGDPDIRCVVRDDVRSYISSLLKTRSASTAATRYRALKQFFRWCLEEGEIERDPMHGIKAPKVPSEPPDVLTNSEIERLFNACKGVGFRDRRDMAILRLLLSSGMRLSELTNIMLEDIDRDAGVILVMGKGQKRRMVPLGSKTKQALDRYTRARARHRLAHRPELWLAERGPLTPSGVYQAVINRGQLAKVSVHPHQFRHTFAHRFRSRGGGVDDLMELAGWSSVEMALRYGKSAAQERAINTHKRLGIGDEF